MKNIDKAAIGYWGTTGLLAFALLGSGFAKLTQQAPLVESMGKLGYPTYILTILGAWMVAGAVVLMIPRAGRLKEWAYAGIVFQMTGAIASHAFVGDPISQSVPTMIITALAVASYSLRPSNRRLDGGRATDSRDSNPALATSKAARA